MNLASTFLGSAATGHLSPEGWDCRVREAMLPAAPFGPETPCRLVFELLTTNPDYPAVAIVEPDGAVIGAVTRNSCIDTLAKPLLLDLYAKRPIRQLMKDPVTIDGETTLDVATEIISRQRPEALIDGFVVVDRGRYAGLVSPQGLLALNIDQSRRRAGHMQAAQDSIIRRQREADAAREHLGNLLDSSGQGFLSFAADLVVDPQFSAACSVMLGRAPGGHAVTALLFPDDAVAADLFCTIVGKVFAEAHSVMREVLLSLLPEEVALGGKVLRMEFRLLDSRRMMLVLTDQTERRRLERAVEAERKHLEMIVAAICQRRDFCEAVDDFRQFAAGGLAGLLAASAAPKAIFDELYREVHTYKGLFNQLSFEKLPAALHEVEGLLAAMRTRDDRLTLDNIAAAATSVSLRAVLDADLSVVAGALGESFLDGGHDFHLSADQALGVERLAKALAEGGALDLAAPETTRLLEQLASIRKVSLLAILASFDRVVAQMALRLGKDVAPLVVLGGDVAVDPDRVRPLQRSLVHVFRNAVAHGIEDADDRLRAGKDEAGHIICRVACEGDQVRIEIGDDGRGVDVDALRAKAVGLGLFDAADAAELGDDRLIDTIFTDHVSTAAELSDLAGRGVGLSAVRSAVGRLGGEIHAETVSGEGTRFVLVIPRRTLVSEG